MGIPISTMLPPPRAPDAPAAESDLDCEPHSRTDKHEWHEQHRADEHDGER